MKKERKICPLLTIAYRGEIEEDDVGSQCEEEFCAWWEYFTGTCCVKTSAYLEGQKVALLEGLGHDAP